MIFRILLTALLLSLGATAFGQETKTVPAYTIREQALGPVPAAGTIRKEWVTHDGHNVVWRVSSANGEAIVLNGRPDPPFTAIKSSPVVSPDGRRAAYKIDVEAGTKRALVVDSRTGIGFDQVNNDSILFSPDSKHFAYSADRNGIPVLMRDDQVLAEGATIKSDAVFSSDFSRVAYKVELPGGKRAVKLDGKIGPAFPQVDNGSMMFSRDSRRFVYVASNGDGQPASATVVLDGQPGETYERVSALTFSPDSSHLAYIADRAGKERVVLDGTPRPEYDSIDPYFLRFTPSGSLGYRAQSGRRMDIVLNGKVIATSPGILDWSAGAQGRGAAIITRSGDTWSVVFNSAKGADYDAIPAPAAVSPDGVHVAYAARRGQQWFAVKDGTPGAAWELMAQSPRFSADGSHWGYVARRGGKWFVVVDGHENGPYDWFAWNGLRFSPDGKRTAFIVQQGLKWIVVVDGKTLVECDGVATAPLRWSADGEHLACMVRQGAEWRVVLDGAPGPLFDRLFDIVPEFRPDGSLDYPAVRDNVLYRVSHVAAAAR